jgi:quercetin dioxygenase-like cupin family protein
MRATRYFLPKPSRFIVATTAAHTEAAAKQKEMKMSASVSKGLLRAVAATTLVVAMGFAFSAQAGECPTDKRMANARQPVDFKAVGVTDTTLGSIDLGKEKAKIANRELRFRKLVIEPGGIVPWHSHDDRPALIFVQQGEIIEYASNCAAPIVHKTGEIRAETQGTSHWWKNLGQVQVILYVGDVRHDETDHNM